MLGYPQCGECAFKSSAHQSEPVQSMPESAKGDIGLPLPYDGQMLFRPVFVPSDALIRDKAFPMGINNLRDQERQIFERQFTGHISAPFTVKDVPPDWKLDNSRRGSWYFMGKYEVTRSQWQQVMEGLLTDGEKNPSYEPAKLDDPGLPVTNVSWPAVQEFLQKYNNWLIKYQVGKLPKFKDTRNVGFLRLPTEAEWEYAARGGDKVPREWLEQEDFHPLADGKSYADYAVFSSPRILEKPMPVGSRQPNPLEIYDTAGNVREMVNGFFHMSIADMVDDKIVRRLHGGAGGLIAKGGSFSSAESGILPGTREEIPLYSLDGAVGARDLGFRVVLAGVNLQGGERLNELKKESGTLPTQPQARTPVLGEGMSAREMLAVLAADSSGDLKENLGKIEAALDDQNNAEKNRALKNLEDNYRSLLYQAETLRAFAFRYFMAKPYRDKFRKLLAQELDKATKAKVEQGLAEAEKDLNDYLKSLEMGAIYYKSLLENIYGQSQIELARLAAQFKEEYGGDGVFNEHMRQNIQTLERYLALVRQKGMNSLLPRTVLKGILPDSHYKELPVKIKG